MKINIHSVLSIWGKQWARYKDVRGFPSMEAFMRESPRPAKYYGLAQLDDETCVAIDKLVQALHDNDLLQYQILTAKYVLLREDKEVWQTLELKRATYYAYLEQAKRFMEGAFVGAEIRVML